MKLYHYITKGNNALEKRILSFAANSDADISYYIKRSGFDNKKDIVQWMESCFEGRSCGIRGFSEPIKWHKNSLSLKRFVDGADKFAIDLDALESDGMIEAVYCSPAGVVDDPSQIVYGTDEVLIKLESIAEISCSPVDWSKCNDELGLRFHVVPYYLIIVKCGIIPPQYIRKED